MPKIVVIVVIYLSVCLSVCLSVYLSIHPSIHPSIYLSIYLSPFIPHLSLWFWRRYLSIYPHLSSFILIYLFIPIYPYLSHGFWSHKPSISHPWYQCQVSRRRRVSASSSNEPRWGSSEGSGSSGASSPKTGLGIMFINVYYNNVIYCNIIICTYI